MTEKASEITAGMSNPAKILLAYMRLTNRWDSRELAAEFDVPLRTIQRWKMECAASATDATNATNAIFGVKSEDGHNATRATDATDGAPLTPDMALAQDVHSCAGANIESPTEITLYQGEVVTPLVPQDVEMLSPAEPAPAENQKTRGTRLDDDWALPTEWRQWAEINTQLGSAGIEMEADKFRDFWIAQPGAKGRKSNWMATWRNWCRNAGSRRPYSPQRMAYDERKATAPKMGISEAFDLYRQGARV